MQPTTKHKKREEIRQAFKKKGIVVYTTIDGMHFILNPFGGGVNTTGEFQVNVDVDTMTPEQLERVTIIIL